MKKRFEKEQSAYTPFAKQKHSWSYRKTLKKVKKEVVIQSLHLARLCIDYVVCDQSRLQQVCCRQRRSTTLLISFFLPPFVL